jgi:hypothetical protein
MKTKILHLQLPEDLHTELKVLAAQKKTTITELVVSAAQKLVDRNQKKDV